METVKIESARGVTTVMLNRPEVRNAFNDVLVRELAETFATLPPQTRVVVLAGAGPAFCAGADLQWMMKSAQASEAENLEDARFMGRLFDTIDSCPAVVIGRIHGPVMGGGLGLLSCCDVAVAVDSVNFAFTEVRLGLVPAVISPFVLAKLRPTIARRVFTTGEKFSAMQAKEWGLVHEVVSVETLDTTVQQIVDAILQNSPAAVAEAKRLVRLVSTTPRAEVVDEVAGILARLRRSPDAIEGFTAFAQKRKPSWAS